MITLDDIITMLQYNCGLECSRRCGGTCSDMLDLSYGMILARDY